MDVSLSPRGQSVYDALTKDRGELSAAHLAMALNAARIADTLDRIEVELSINPNLTVVNGQGTVTVNPLITESRMLTGALSQILAKMGIAALPEVEKRERSKLDELAERRAERLARASNAENSVQPRGG